MRDNSKNNYVCIDCRVARREVPYKLSLEKGATCHSCGNRMTSIGFRWRVPKKNDTRGWKKLEKRFKHFIEMNEDC